jgi:Ca2+/Na+ antiporter
MSASDAIACLLGALFFGAVIGVGWTASISFRRISLRELIVLVGYWALLAFLLTVFASVMGRFSA